MVLPTRCKWLATHAFQYVSCAADTYVAQCAHHPVLLAGLYRASTSSLQLLHRVSQQHVIQRNNMSSVDIADLSGVCFTGFLSIRLLIPLISDACFTSLWYCFPRLLFDHFIVSEYCRSFDISKYLCVYWLLGQCKVLCDVWMSRIKSQWMCILDGIFSAGFACSRDTAVISVSSLYIW